LSKERAEFFADGMAGVITDFKQLELVKGGNKDKIVKRMVTEKGHKNEFEKFFEIFRRNERIDFESHIKTTIVTFKAVESIQKGLQIKF